MPLMGSLIAKVNNGSFCTTFLSNILRTTMKVWHVNNANDTRNLDQITLDKKFIKFTVDGFISIDLV
jgi:hypothetical protein